MKSSETLIHNIILSQSLLVHYESRIILDDISDHLPSLSKLEDALEKKNVKKIITSQNVGERNLEKINNSLSKQNWSSVITENVDESFNNVHDLLQNTIELHTPKVTRKLRNKSFRHEQWLSPAILRSINRQKKLYIKTIKASSTEQDIVKYKNYKRILDKLKRFA